MPDSVSQFFLDHFPAHQRECAYKQRRGYRMEAFTYGDIVRLATGFAAGLEQRGIQRRTRDAVGRELRTVGCRAFFGCALRGVVVVPMDDAVSPDFASRVFAQVQGKLMVASRAHASQSRAGPDSTLILEELNSPNIHLDTLPQSTVAPEDVLQIVFTQVRRRSRAAL